MNLGDVVILKVSVLGNTVGSIGVCYEEYGNSSCSFIFENGNYDGFTENEQLHFLFLVDYDINTSSYMFSNVIELSNDFGDGKFDNVFNLSDLEKFEYIKMLREYKIDSIID